MRWKQGEIFSSIKEAVRKTGFGKIGEVCRGHRNTAGGCHWEYFNFDDIV